MTPDKIRKDINWDLACEGMDIEITSAIENDRHDIMFSTNKAPDKYDLIWFQDHFRTLDVNAWNNIITITKQR